MAFSETNTFIPLIAAGCYTLLIIIAFTQRDQQERQKRWLLAFLAVSVLWEFLLLFARGVTYPPNLPAKMLLVGTTLLGVMTAVFVNWSQQKRWLLFGGLAITITLLLDFLLPIKTTSLPFGNFGNQPISYSDLFTTITWLLLSSVILSRTWRDYQATNFPWHANRLLFWLLVLMLTFAGEALLFFQFTGLTIAGQIVRFLGVIGLTYAVSSHRLVDVRTQSQSALAFVIISVLSIFPLAATISIVQNLSRNNQPLIIVTVTLSLLLYAPIRRFVEKSFRKLLVGGEGIDTNQVLRHYSQAIYQILDVQQLSQTIINTLSDLLGCEHGALMLVTPVEDGYDIEPIPALGAVPKHSQRVPSHSPFIQSFSQLSQPLLQYDLDFKKDYTEITPAVRDWLNRMAMDVYVPVSAGATLEGLITIGPRTSGVPYQPRELELVQILADQTVVALQNARLYRELGHQNQRINRLNKSLTNQNERLETLDRVKTDFITIASHELRTPLTQVKGYTDILQAMNEESELERDETNSIIGHISSASDRLDSIITAMLDASQLDTEGFHLVFMETNIKTIIELALEPLSQAMKDRHISWQAQGLDSTPKIFADPKRLVQVFTNLIGNAIKYTPDYGTISLEASRIPDQNGKSEHVEIIIEDQGIGIDAKFHNLIFEKFFRVGDPQLHSTGSTKFKGAGPGLGLPIAKGVIEGHGGRIWVESEGEDEEKLPGSQFFIILPTHPPNMDEANRLLFTNEPGF